MIHTREKVCWMYLLETQNHLEWQRDQKTFKTIKSSHPPHTTSPPLNHVPKHHISWTPLHHLPGWPIPMLVQFLNTFRKEILSDTQSNSPLAQLEAVTSVPSLDPWDKRLTRTLLKPPVRQNSPGSVSSCSEVLFPSPCASLIALLWTLLSWGAQNHEQYSRHGLTRAEHRGTSTSLGLWTTLAALMAYVGSSDALHTCKH